MEKINNIERFANTQTIKTEISTALKSLAKREREMRELTLTFKTDHEIKQVEIIEEIENVKETSAPINSWQDKDKAFIKFYSKEAKNKIIKQMQKAMIGSTMSRLYLLLEVDKNAQPKQLVRKPARVEIQNVKATILLKQIIKLFEDVQDGEPLFNDFKEGKLIAKTNNRLISFSATAMGIERIFKNYGGIIPIKTGQYQAKLFPRVNVKPYICRDCGNIGSNHTCPGKVCNNCGETNHKANECKKENRYCLNCKRGGHKTRDNNCPRFLQAVTREIERKDIPLEFYEDAELRAILIKNLQLN